MVLRPNVLELGAVAFYPLGAAFGMAWLIIFNRKSAGDAPVLVMQFVLALFAAPLLLVAAAAVLSAVGGAGFRSAPSGEVVAEMRAGGGSRRRPGTCSSIAATMRASAALVSPMTYVQLIVAAALGWAWFGDAPDAGLTYAGRR
jgi:drug/metabolite transporter (DMT)-like permease